jgi:hypothetical protein
MLAAPTSSAPSATPPPKQTGLIQWLLLAAAGVLVSVLVYLYLV